MERVLLDEALDKLWRRWEMAGFQRTVDEALRVEALLERLSRSDYPPSIERLGGMLAALVAHNADAQARFHTIFRDCFPHEAPVASPPISPRPGRITWPLWALGALLLAGFLGGGIRVLIPKPIPTPTSRPTPTPSPTPTVSTRPTPTPSPRPTPTPRPSSSAPPESAPPSFQINLRSGDERTPIRALVLLGALPAAGAGLWMEALRRGREARRRQQAARRANLKPHRRLPLRPLDPYGHASDRPFDPLQETPEFPINVRRSQIALRQTLGDRIAARPTVEATIRLGGIPTLVLQQRRVRRRVVAVVEFHSLADHLTPYALAILRRMDRLGVAVDVFLVRPRTLDTMPLARRERGFVRLDKTPDWVPLESLLQSIDREGTTLAYFGAGEALAERRPDIGWTITDTGKRIALGWDRALLLLPARPAWDRALAEAFQVAPIAWATLEVALSHEDEDEAAAPLEDAVPEEMTDAEARLLLFRIPVSAQRWLVALAALPERRWDLTLDVGNALDASGLVPAPVVTEENLRALLALPWFRSSAPLPDQLKEALETSTPPAILQWVHQRARAIVEQDADPGTWFGLKRLLDAAFFARQAGDRAAAQGLIDQVLEIAGPEFVREDTRFAPDLPTAPRPPRPAVVYSASGFAALALGAGLAFVPFGPGLFGLSRPTPKWHIAPPIDFAEVRGLSERTIALRNGSDRPVSLSVAIAPGSDPAFRLSSETGGDLSPRATLSFPIEFDGRKATGTSALTGNLRITVGHESVDLALRGGVAAPLTVAPSPIVFKASPSGRVDSVRVTVTNRSSAPARLKLSIRNDAERQYTVAPADLSVPARKGANPGTAPVTVRYRRTAAGDHRAELVLTETDRKEIVDLIQGQTTLPGDDSETNIATLLPSVQPIARQFLAEVRKTFGVRARITEGIGPEPCHRNGIAWDVTVMDAKGRPIPATDKATLAPIAEIARRMGLDDGQRPGLDAGHVGILVPATQSELDAAVRANGGAYNRGSAKDALELLCFAKPVRVFRGTEKLDFHARVVRGNLWVDVDDWVHAFGGSLDRSSVGVRISLGGRTAIVTTVRLNNKHLARFLSVNNLYRFVYQWDPSAGTVTFSDTKLTWKSLYPALAHYLDEMRDIPAGTFDMGSRQSMYAPVHSVTVSAFRIGKTPVTVAVWKEYVAKSSKSMPKAPVWGWIDDHPMVNVSWKDIVGKDGQPGFCAWVKQVSGISVSLPTEAQWEYAARGGLPGIEYPWSDLFDGTKAWSGVKDLRHSNLATPNRTAPVQRTDRIFANGYGLTDMSGNVYQWCSDWFGKTYYTDAKANRLDPNGPIEGNLRICRGGSWSSGYPDFFRCANRFRYDPGLGADNLGFRLAAPGTSPR